jgi:beta-lactamase class A
MRWLAVTASVLALAVSAEPVARADDDMDARVAAADSYLATRPGVVGYVLRDRKTGAVYRNAHAADPVWTASTIKLAMVVDLLTRHRSGARSR